MPEGLPDIPIPSITDPELGICPHCQAKTRLIADDRFRWVCGACAGARVPSGDPKAHSAAEYEHLQRSKRLTQQAHIASFGGALTALAGTGSALIAMICLFAFHVNPAISLVLIVMSVVAFMVTVGFGRSGRKKIDDAKTEVTSAWELVAEALLKIHGRALTAAELGTMMQTTEADAERLLTLLSVDDKVHSTVTEDAQVRYSAPPQMRVDNPLATAETTLAPSIREEDMPAVRNAPTRTEQK